MSNQITKTNVILKLWIWNLVRLNVAIFATSYPILGGIFDPRCVSWTLDLYRSYADKAVVGGLPYRHYLIEYPIAAFPLFFLPRLVAAGPAGYRLAFGAEMLLFDAAAAYLVARQVERSEGIAAVQARVGWYTLFFIGVCPLALGRYDLAPMAIAFAAACWWFSGRYALGGAVAGFGGLMKVFPGVAAAPALLWEATRLRVSRGRGLLGFFIAVNLLTTLWFAIGGEGVMDSLRYQAKRGLGVDSLYAGLIYFAGRITGVEIISSLDHRAFHLASPWSRSFAMIAPPIQVSAVLLILWRYRRSGMADGIRYTGAAVLAFMALGKVLSPQFLIWPIPFIVVLGGRTGQWSRWLYLLACLATTLIYPGSGLKGIMANRIWAIGLVNVRNALLLAVLALQIFGPEAGGSRLASKLRPGEP